MTQPQSSKPCAWCGRDLPLSAYGRHTQSGLQPRCRECLSQTRREWREANAEKVKAAKRDFSARTQPDRVAATRAWRLAHPERARETTRRWLEAHPEKQREYDARRAAKRPPKAPRVLLTPEQRRLRAAARAAVTYAVTRGALCREPCASCGAEPAQAHHHRGYAREHWLDVQWLCSDCHWSIHPKPT